MEYLVNCYGLKVIIQTENNMLNIKMISTDEQKLAYLLQLKCRVPQVSTLGLFHFLIYINDFSLVSKYLSSAMFADNTNLFFFSQKYKNFM